MLKAQNAVIRCACLCVGGILCVEDKTCILKVLG